MPDIFKQGSTPGGVGAAAAQFQDVNLDNGAAIGDGEEGGAGGKNELEISDEEAPDVEDAKRNLRSQAERKRKQKKTKVGGVTGDVELASDQARPPGTAQS